MTFHRHFRGEQTVTSPLKWLWKSFMSHSAVTPLSLQWRAVIALSLKSLLRCLTCWDVRHLNRLFNDNAMTETIECELCVCVCVCVCVYEQWLRLSNVNWLLRMSTSGFRMSHSHHVLRCLTVTLWLQTVRHVTHVKHSQCDCETCHSRQTLTSIVIALTSNMWRETSQKTVTTAITMQWLTMIGWWW